MNVLQRRTIAGALAVGFLLIALTACDAILTPPPTATPTPAPTSGRGLATPTISPGIYLTPIPPTPTFTPSPTPTPVVHVVASGDTLFGIALDYGVSVDALVRVNGLDENDFLSIGQVLIIPLEEEDELTDEGMQVPQGNVILPTPTPMGLSITGVTFFHTPVGGIWCMGEVLNTTGETVTNLQVAVDLLAPDDTPVMTGRALAAGDYLAPQERAPFSVLFKNPPDGVVGVRASLLRGEAISPITSGFQPITILSAEGSISGPQYRVRGTLRNDGGQALTRISVVATIYNADGDVVGYRELVLPEDIALNPGDERAFDLLLTPQEVTPPSGFSAIAWGEVG